MRASTNSADRQRRAPHRFWRPSIHSCPPLVRRTTPHFDATMEPPCGRRPAALIWTRPSSQRALT